MAKRPNILVIMTDQHRLSAVGAYGPTVCQTPHIDGLAAAGLRCDRAYCPTAICSPSRASFLTGMLPHRHGVTANIGDLGCNQQHIADTPELLSRRLGAAGYGCGLSGKWHLCAEADKRTRYQADYILSLPSTLGFVGQDFPGHGGGGFGYPEFRDYLAAHGWSGEVSRIDAAFGHEAGIWQGPVESTVPYFLTSHSIDLIDRFQAEGTPWFIWHNFWGPHEPYIVPQAYFDRYAEAAIEPWPDFGWDAAGIRGPHQRWLVRPEQPWSYWQELLRYYYAFASLIDDQVGRLVSHLEAIGELDDTYVVFTADHGESLGSHGGLANKGVQAFEETVQVPLIIRGPDIEPGSVSRALISNMDLHATICGWAGTTPGASSNCIDLGPVCRGDDQVGRDCWVVESHGVMGFCCTQRVLRWGDLSYCWSAGFPELLFDLANDPHQLHNLADDPTETGRLAACRERLDQWMVAERDQARPAFVQDRLLAKT